MSGILDFGALALDSIAADLARYLGGFSVEERSFWAPALNAYDTERPLSRDERVLIAAYDRSGALLNALNWLRWLAVERRSFPAAADVENRLHELRARLERYTVAPEIHPALL